jgi:hypothetical protein
MTPSVSPTPVSPANLLDYIFLFSYPVAFIGAIFFSISNALNLKPLAIIGNNQVELGINIYIAIAGILSILLWLQPSNIGPLTTLSNNIITSLSPVYNINTIKTTSSF